MLNPQSREAGKPTLEALASSVIHKGSFVMDDARNWNGLFRAHVSEDGGGIGGVYVNPKTAETPRHRETVSRRFGSSAVSPSSPSIWSSAWQANMHLELDLLEEGSQSVCSHVGRPNRNRTPVSASASEAGCLVACVGEIIQGRRFRGNRKTSIYWYGIFLNHSHLLLRDRGCSRHLRRVAQCLRGTNAKA